MSISHLPLQLLHSPVLQPPLILQFSFCPPQLLHLFLLLPELLLQISVLVVQFGKLTLSEGNPEERVHFNRIRTYEDIWPLFLSLIFSIPAHPPDE